MITKVKLGPKALHTYKYSQKMPFGHLVLSLKTSANESGWKLLNRSDDAKGRVTIVTQKGGITLRLFMGKTGPKAANLSVLVSHKK